MTVARLKPRVAREHPPLPDGAKWVVCKTCNGEGHGSGCFEQGGWISGLCPDCCGHGGSYGPANPGGKAKKRAPSDARIQPPKDGPFRLRVGNGEEEGHIKLDIAPPWPVDDGVVDTVYSSFQFHRLGRPDRYRFMNEAHRVLKPGSQVILVMPHWLSQRAITDPLAEWPPLAPGSFMVYSKKWREQEQMTDLPLTCDFGDVFGYGDARHPEFEASLVGRNDEFVMRAIDQAHHELDRFTDLHITLTRV